jgi:DNA-binding NarL/FixJ family response regulator
MVLRYIEQNRLTNFAMSDELSKLLLVDSDRIFRIGMRSWLAQFPDLEAIAEAETAEDVLRILQEVTNIDLVIIDLNLSPKNRELAKFESQSGLELCQQLKSQYPHLPIFLLSSLQDSKLVEMALRIGVDGYCLKGTDPEVLVTAIRQVALGNQYWGDRDRLETNQTDLTIVAIAKRNLYLSGLRQIDRVLMEVKGSVANRKHDQIGDRLAKIVLAGQARELAAARWLLNQLWGQKTTPVISEEIPSPDVEVIRGDRLTNKSQNISNQNLNNTNNNALAIQASLWDKTVTKLQANLLNSSKIPLEIDVLKNERKRELLYIVLRQIEQSLTELRFSEIRPSQLSQKIPDILKGIWQEAVIGFFGKYYVINNISNSSIEVNSEVNVVDILIDNLEIVQTEFLNKIPHIDNLLSHLLFETELIIDNSSASMGTPEAMQRTELILDNLIIQIANGVIQPLLNNFANVEEIKQNFYRYNLLGTREIEKFRNDLSWKYRLEKYITVPQLIFESRQVLLTFTDRGITRINIYMPRNQELQQLEGVQLAVTLILELQDAIAPRLKSAIAFLGSGFVYVLTNVIGRGIGLIGRGVVQGIGNAWQDSRAKK